MLHGYSFLPIIKCDFKRPIMIKKFLICISIILLPTFASASQVSKLFAEGSYDAAFREGYADALSGDPESSYVIGRILIEGRGSGKNNVNKGIDFLNSSAKANYLKAVEFLAKNYDEGQFTSENSTIALKYYEQAEKLGSKKAWKRIKELRIALFGKISKKSCETYNKKDKNNYFNIAQCIARNFLDGNASSYYLMAFDNGNSGAYLLAAQRMLEVKDIDLFPLVKRIPDFKNKADQSQQNKFVNLINQFGYDGSFCGVDQSQDSKKDIFAKPKKKSTGNNAACALAAEAGDPIALPIAYEWWMNGFEDFPRSKKYASNLMKKIENNEDVDIATLLRKFEDNPKKHYEKAMEYIKSNPFNVSVVGSELELEIKLIAEKDFQAFAQGYLDIANVIEYVDWENIPSQTIANFYQVYKLDLLDHNHGGVLDTPRVKNNLDKIPYNISFISSLSKLEGGGKLANEFLISRLDQCEPLKYAINNRDQLDIPFQMLQEAQQNSLNRCTFDQEKKSMEDLLKIAKSDLDTVKSFIERRLNQRLPCMEYEQFLEYNKNDLSDFDVNYDDLNDQCSAFPVVAVKLATKLYENKFYDEAYNYALKGCDSEEHPSKSEGCDLLALIIIKGQTTNTEDMTFDKRMGEALIYLNIGHEKGDIKSSAYLHDISDQFILFSKHADPDLAADILPILKKSRSVQADLQIRKKCFRQDPIKRVFNSCAKHCTWAKRISKTKGIDPVSLYLLEPIFKDQACSPSQTN